VIEIPPGAANYVIEDTFTLPVDVHALAVLPHAHYLAREIEGWAVKPDGMREPLIWIRKWDFNWQSDYRYAKPVFLPRGTTLSMRISYDNSAGNLRNPNHPPQPVSYGAQSSDEMAELWFQLLPRTAADLTILNRAYDAKSRERLFAKGNHDIQKNPNDPKANAEVGLMKLGQGKMVEAEKHFETAIKADPKYPLGHYYYGILLRQKNLLKAARQEFELVTQLEPQNGKAHGNLAFVLLDLGDLTGAKRHLQEALRLNPFDQLAKQTLSELTRTNHPP
jgi:tetratricopeptide (TPR) repeat protein